MQPIKGNIIVKVLLDQNAEAKIGGIIMKTARRYSENFREKNPVIAEVIEGCDGLESGSIIVCNYNLFDEESPLQLIEDTFSIPADEEIFATVNDDGELTPLFGNVFASRVTKNTPLPLPEELKKPHVNQGVVLSGGNGYLKDQYIFWLPYADYEIVYYWKGEERRVIKVHKSEITGYLIN